MHVRHALKNIPVLFSVKQQGEIICGFDNNLSKEQKLFSRDYFNGAICSCGRVVRQRCVVWIRWDICNMRKCSFSSFLGVYFIIAKGLNY